MTPASLQLVIGVLDILLRILVIMMAVGTVFLFSLQSFASRTMRATETDKPLRVEPDFPKPEPFVMRSTRSEGTPHQRRAA